MEAFSRGLHADHVVQRRRNASRTIEAWISATKWFDHNLAQTEKNRKINILSKQQPNLLRNQLIP